MVNTGDMEGSRTVVLKIKGVKEVDKNVTVAADDSRRVSFTVSKEDAGNYSVVVDGLSGSFTIVAPPAPPIKPSINRPLLGGIVAVVVVGLLIFFLGRRRISPLLPTAPPKFRARVALLLALLVLLATIAGCGGDIGQLPEAANTFTIEGWVTVDAYHYDEATGTYIHFYHDESSNLVVDIGKDWVEDQLGDSPGTDPAKWISLSTDASALSAAWTQIPTEITTGGLARAAGTYASTGTGVWTISNTFTATAERRRLTET